MSPMRLLILGLLVYIVYRLLIGKRSSAMPGGRRRDAIQDVLVEDPVCHAYIPKGEAVQLQYKKRLYHFCSQQCRQTFLAEKGETK